METRAVSPTTFPRACSGRRPKALIALLLALTLVASLAFGASAALAAGPATIVDSGFESGADGAALSPSAWTLSGTPTRAEYDTTQAKSGLLSGWIAGPAAAGVAGVSTPVVMTSNSSEYRFWVYADSANENRYVSDTGSVFELRTDTTGKVLVYTKRTAIGYTANAYTAVGTYAAGWTEYRVVLDFTGDTYTLFRRSNPTDTWTPLKSATALTYAIPMREATDRTTTANLLFRAYTGADLWVDDVAYADGGIVDADVTAPAAPSTLSAVDTPADTGSSINVSWAAATDNVGVTGYKLYRGTAAGIYGAPVALGNATTYTDAAATTGTRYYYAVSAVDAAGNEGAKSPESSAIAVDNSIVVPPAGFDGTFESGADGASLTPDWTLSGTPQRAEYDTARAKNGVLSGWIQGPTTAAAAGASLPAVMTSDGAEYRFWMYTDTANENRYVTDTGSVFELRTDTTGKLLVYTKRTATGYAPNAYTAVGTYAVGWAEYRIVLDFTSDTYTLFKRSNATDAWTPLKSATAPTYAIPMREATDRTTTANWLFRGYTNADLWVDDLRFSDTGLTDPPVADTTAPSAPLSSLAVDTPSDQGSSISLSWPAATDNVAVTGYRVYRGTAPGTYGAPTALGNVTSYTDATAVTGTRYYYAVSAVDAAGNEGLKSPEATAIALDNLAPAVPAGLAAVGGTKQVVLTWNANTEPDLSGYDVLRDGVKVNVTRLTATTFTDTGLADGTTYAYRIVASDTHGNSSTGPAVSGTTQGSGPDVTPPAAPATLSAIDRPADTGGAINLSWAAATDNVGVTGYRLYRGTVAGTYGAPTVLGNVTSYVDATAVTGTRYYYAVSAVDAAGNEGAKSPESSAIAVDNSVTPPAGFDGTFENAADGAALTANGWTLSGTPQRAEYDTARAKNGTLSGWIQGPTTAAAAGASVPAVMTSNGAEYRFWMYTDTANENRYVTDTGSVFEFRTDTTGKLLVYTKRAATGYAANAYAAVGTYAVGWAEYRIVLDFTGDTYTLSKRSNATDAWTPLKSATASTYAIPMREATDRTTTANILFRGYTNADMWLDDVRFSDTGIVEADTTAPSAPTTLSAVDRTGDSGGATNLTWTAATDNVAVTGYKLYRGTTPGTYGAPTTLGNVTTYTDTTATTGTRYYYAVAAVDAAGNEGAKSPEANATSIADAVILPPGSEMPVTYVNCDSCHAVGSPLDEHDHPCASCHSVNDGHLGTPSQYHLPAEVTACTPCHNASLTVEHQGRKTDAGTAIVCDTCHGSANTSVKAAIAAGNSACSACHGSTDHSGMHGSETSTTPLPASGLVCGDCHDPDLQVEHVKPTASSAAAGCSSCHPMPRNTLTAAWNKTCSQDACHATGSATEMHAGTTTAHAPLPANSSCFGTGCHSSTDLSATHSLATTTVAGDVRTSCLVCHADGTPASKDCSACHTTGSYHTAQNGVHTTMTITNCFGAGCHDASKRLDTVHDKYVGTGAWFPQYATSCDLCHRNADPARINWAVTTPHQRCTGLCHSVDAHAKASAKHTVTAASATCTSSDCHGTDLLATHAAYPAGSQCGLCHDDRTNWSKTADCVSCHNTASPHPTADASHTASPAAQTVTISGVSFGPVACADCHSLPLLTSVHTGACKTCHPSPKSTLAPAWDKSCTQGGCHTATSAAPMHASIDASHAPVAGQTCYTAGCHPATATDSLAQTHRNASATLGGSLRTSCQVCHWNGTPASRECASCHADRVDGSHGFSVQTHTAVNSCASSCHSENLGTTHVNSSCTSCHTAMVSAIQPWTKQCSACHSTNTHTPPVGAHVGSDAGSGSAYLGYGCNGLEGMTCHNIDDVSVLHANVHDGSGGCSICHASGVTPRSTCVSCHASGWGGDTSWMHHNNTKYVANSAETTPGQYFADNPAGGWDDNLYNYDCQYCHVDFYGGASAPAPQPIQVYQGNKMWYSGLRSAAGGLADTNLQIATMTVPANASLEFMTSYDAEIGSDYGYVEVTADGETWTPIAGTITTTANPKGLNLGNGINGNSGGWVPATFDLSAYSGQTVSFRLRFISDRYINLAGWAVDNIVISGSGGTVFADNAEAENPSLASAGWLRVGAYPPAFLPYDLPTTTKVDVSHAPPAGQTCYASGCHPSTQTDSLVKTHKNASAVLGGKTRTNCQVCHWNGMPASAECASCHAGTNAIDHTPLHNTGFDAASCGGCHNSNLLTEHTTNRSIPCAACHDNPLEVRYGQAVAWGQTSCADCHSAAHGQVLESSVPASIPLDPRFAFSTPMAADLFSAEPWMLPSFVGVGAQMVVSNRVPTSADAVWAWYSAQLTGSGWTVASGAPTSGDTAFTATFVNGRRHLVLWCYGGEDHAAAPLSPAGYRVELSWYEEVAR